MATCRRFDPSLTGSDTKELTFRLMNVPGFLPDVLHDYKRMMLEYQHMMETCCQPFAMVCPDNKMGGAFFLGDVSPGHEGTLFVWIWDPRCYTATTRKFLDGYVEHFAEDMALARMVCRTPDDGKLGRLLERMGFKLEGRFRNGWKGGGRLSPLYQYRKLFRVVGGS